MYSWGDKPFKISKERKMETVMVCGNKELKKIQELIEDDKEILLCYNKKLLKIKNMVSIEARTILCTIGEISKELIEHIDIVSAFIVASDDVKL